MATLWYYLKKIWNWIVDVFISLLGLDKKKAANKPAPKPNDEPKAKPKAKPEVKDKPKPKAKGKGKGNEKGKTNPKPKPKAKAKGKGKGKAKPKLKPKSKSTSRSISISSIKTKSDINLAKDPKWKRMEMFNYDPFEHERKDLSLIRRGMVKEKQEEIKKQVEREYAKLKEEIKRMQDHMANKRIRKAKKAYKANVKRIKIIDDIMKVRRKPYKFPKARTPLITPLSSTL